jgi:hypothetical protein
MQKKDLVAANLVYHSHAPLGPETGDRKFAVVVTTDRFNLSDPAFAPIRARLVLVVNQNQCHQRTT